MIETEKLNLRIAKLDELLATKLRLRGKGLSNRLRRAGRMLPKHVRNAGAVIVRAEAQAAHPKLARLVDQARLDWAFTVINTHLEGIDPKARRKDKILGVLGVIVFNLILLVAMVFAVMSSRGTF